MNRVDIETKAGERFTAELLGEDVSGMPRQPKLVLDARRQDIDAQPPFRYLCADGLHRVPKHDVVGTTSVNPAPPIGRPGPFISVWTNEDTSEAGPTVDEKLATVTVERGPDGETIALHVMTDDGSVGLWTINLTLSRKHAGNLVADLQQAIDGRSPR